MNYIYCFDDNEKWIGKTKHKKEDIRKFVTPSLDIIHISYDEYQLIYKTHKHDRTFKYDSGESIFTWTKLQLED